MTNGVLMFAHNSRKIDYALMSIISGGLAKRNLQVPVSLVTDESTLQWMKESNIFEKAKEVFEHIILTERPNTNNQRRLRDGLSDDQVPFINADRCAAWHLTPYDRTLLIDTDFLIFSNHLNEYWDIDQDVMISSGINDVYGEKRLGYHDRYVSDTGIKLYWATNVMFTKNQQSKFFFETVEYVKNNYKFYSDLFRFDNRQYRNDISFSVAKHILDGNETPNIHMLPPVLTALDRDILINVDKNKLTFLINYNLDNNFCAAVFSKTDIHIMNKQSIYRNKDKLLEFV